MTVAAGFWAILGIEPCKDLKTVRSAYAAKLKTIDVDGDPAAFIALRDAYEAAQDYVRYAAYDDEEEEDFGLDDWDDGEEGEGAQPKVIIHSALPEEDDAPPGFDADIAPDFVPSSPPAADNPWREPTGEELYNDIANILYDPEKQGQNLSEEEYHQIQSAARNFVAWLDRATIDDARDYEFSLAHLIAATIPRSDPMLDSIPAYFGWDSNADNYDFPPQVADILERRDSNQAVTMLTRPDHRLHAAFNALTSPVETKRKDKALHEDVRELLLSARRHHPSLKAVFDYDRVAEWERTLKIGDFAPGTAGAATRGEESNSSWWSYWWVFLILISLVRFCDAGDKTPNRPNPLSLPDAAEQQLLENMFNTAFGGELGYAEAKLSVPVFVTLAEINLRASKGSKTLQDQYATADLRSVAQAFVYQKLPTVSDDDLRDYWKLWSDKARSQQKLGVAQCQDFVSRQERDFAFPDEIVKRDQKISAHIIKTYYKKSLLNNLTKPKSFAISGEILGQIIGRTRLSEEDVRSVFDRKGTPKNECAVWIAFTAILSESKSADALTLMKSI
ncbi:MAG: hypothetical protein HC843_06735 [Sphingomonadales bacterium]|nr:hypothetical protein [Sphingomonadales bacterium]